MKIAKKIFLIFSFFFSFATATLSDNTLYYINLDYLIKNSNNGKAMMAELEKIQKKNLEKLTVKKNEIIKIENNLKKQKNIISEDDIKIKITNLNIKLDEFKKYKSSANKEFEIKKKKELKDIFDEINPILESYMKEKSIDILIEKKNVFIGKSKFDITNDILAIVNK